MKLYISMTVMNAANKTIKTLQYINVPRGTFETEMHSSISHHIVVKCNGRTNIDFGFQCTALLEHVQYIQTDTVAC